MISSKPLKRKALFFDRDGVIWQPVPRKQYITRVEQCCLMKGILELVKLVRQRNAATVVVTNQAAIAYSMMTQSDLEKIHSHMKSLLKGGLTAVYYCPHESNDNCVCRKPKPGMLLKAITDHNIDAKDSYMVGDNYTDIEAGQAAGVKTIFIRNDFNSDELPRCSPNHVINHLSEIQSIIPWLK